MARWFHLNYFNFLLTCFIGTTHSPIPSFSPQISCQQTQHSEFQFGIQTIRHLIVELFSLQTECLSLGVPLLIEDRKKL